MKNKVLLLITIFLFSVLVITGCGNNDNKTTDLNPAMFPAPLELGERETKSGGEANVNIDRDKLSELEISGVVDHQGIQNMLEYINEYRQGNGLSPLTPDEDLLIAAETRAAETTLCYSHIRPDQSSVISVDESIAAELIGAGKDAGSVFKSWCEKSENAQLFVNGNFKSVGISNFGSQGRKPYWVILFSTENSRPYKVGNKSENIQKKIVYDPEFCPVEFVLHEKGRTDDRDAAADLAINEQANLEAVVSPYIPHIEETEPGLGTAVIMPNQLKWLTANPYVADVNDGIVTSKSDGKTVVDAVFGTYIGMKEIYSGDYTAKAKVKTGSEPYFINAKFNVYGHRGFSARYPENSILSFTKAAECAAFDGMENDVHTTEDGQIIIMHDDTLDRMTFAKGKISTITYDQSRKIRLTGGNGFTDGLKGELTIPTLSEYLDICYRYRKIAMIELKHLSRYETEIPGLVAYLNDYRDGWFTNHTVFISFNTNYLNAVAECTAIYPLEVMPGGKISVSQAKKLYAEVLKGRKEKDYTLIFRPSVGQLFASNVDDFKKNNIRLDCWGLVNGDKKTFDRLKENGVLGITLDSPEDLDLDMTISDPVEE